MTTKYAPVRGAFYTLRWIETRLDLNDVPFLKFFHQSRSCVVQTSHVTKEELLSSPELADTEWSYSHTTYQRIPVFYARDSAKVAALMDIEISLDPDDTFWVTPKGFPREQYKPEFFQRADGG